MFAKHLPPSAGLPRVLRLNLEATALPEVETAQDGDVCDAVIGHAPPENLAQWFHRLRPGGRLILAWQADAPALLDALTQAGFIHCLVEPHPAGVLYRGERPPVGDAQARLQQLNAHPAVTPFVFVLVTQTPNRPAWQLTAADNIVWQAVTRLALEDHQPRVLGFSALVKAVAFMQTAIRNNLIHGINKVGKFRREVAAQWPHPVWLNPAVETVRACAPGPGLTVDPHHAITGEE